MLIRYNMTEAHNALGGPAHTRESRPAIGGPAADERREEVDGGPAEDLAEGSEGCLEVLRDRRTSKASKTAAGSALSQRAPKKK
jgi:hypothetical protein